MDTVEVSTVPPSVSLGEFVFGPVRANRYRIGECNVLVTKEDGRWHLSMSHPSRLPTYWELKEARYRHVPDDVTMAQLFPPTREFVNVDPNCLHLWEV